MIAVHYGIGRHNYYVPTDQEVLAEKWLFLSQPVFPWSLAFSKMSIACMLIRIRRDQRVWAWGMYFIMVFVVLIAINTNVFQLSLCRPLWAVWDHSNSEAQCMDMTVAQTSIYVNSALNVVTDFALSLAVWSFCHKNAESLPILTIASPSRLLSTYSDHSGRRLRSPS